VSHQENKRQDDVREKTLLLCTSEAGASPAGKRVFFFLGSVLSFSVDMKKKE